MTGAILVVVLDVLPASAALTGVRRGTDVYLFLTGMMLLAELARQTELFGWLAARSAGFARGSATRLFTLIYAVGTLVTVFLSNDATAVVLTPAVAAVARAVKAEQSLPYLLICAFVANAASFVLPISNPANLVLYGTRLPPLVQWVQLYALPSLLAILSTYVILRWTQRRDLRLGIAADIEVPTPSPGAKMAGLGIGASAVVLLVASASGQPLGMPTLAVGVATALAVLARSRADPRAVIAGVSWGVLPLGRRLVRAGGGNRADRRHAAARPLGARGRTRCAVRHDMDQRVRLGIRQQPAQQPAGRVAGCAGDGHGRFARPK